MDTFEISFQGRGFKSLKSDGVVQVADAETRLVLTISDSDEKMSFLAGLKGPGLGLSTPENNTPNYPNSPNTNKGSNAAPIRPLGAAHDLIPSRWIGLDAVDLLVLQDFPHSALTPVQVATLKNYAASGGAILALGGANWQRLSTSPLADLWPVVLQSSGTASPSGVSTLVDRFARFPVMSGADRLGGAPVVASRGVLRPGARLLLGNANAPIFAVNDYGAGQVLYSSIDPTQPPFLGWRGHARMWADIFRPTQRPSQIATVGQSNLDEDNYQYNQPLTNSATSGLLDALKQSKQLKTPPVSVIAWFLALYIFFLVPVNYVLLRFFDRRELAWLTIPIIVLAFSAMSYAAALRIKGTAILTRQVNLIQTSDTSNIARADAMLWLFSPKKTTYDISSKDPQMVVGDYLSDSNVAVSIREPEGNQAFALDAAPINMWDWRSFVGHSTTDLKGGVRAVIGGSAQNGKVGIQNLSPFDLKGVVLVCDNRVLGFKTVKAGSTSFKTDSDKTGNSSQFASLIHSAARLEKELPKNQVGGLETIPDKLLATALKSDGSTPRTFIAAWSDRTIAGLTIGREDAKAQNLTLLLVKIENDASIRRALSKWRQANIPAAATVKRLSVETMPLSQNKQAGSISTYDVQLPAPENRVSIVVKLSVDNSYNYDESNKTNLKNPIVEVFDFSKGEWRAATTRDLNFKIIAAQKAKAKKQKIPYSPPTQWNLLTELTGEQARAAILKPDNRIQFRVHTFHDDVRVTATEIHGGNWTPKIPKPDGNSSVPGNSPAPSYKIPPS